MFDDDLLGDPQNIEEIVENETEEALYLEDDQNEETPAPEPNDDEGAAPTSPTDATGKATEPKKKKVQRPQARLNPERLKGPRGIAVLETVFKDMKFRGKGHEKEDLDHVMKRLELWAHRLYPKFQFEDCLQKIETLGHKRPVMTYVKRIRMGLIDEDEPLITPEEEIGTENEPALDDLLPIDEFDALIGQQLSNVPTNPPVSAAQTPSVPSTTLSEEQRERMLRNRLLAEERRLARMKAQKENEIQNTETLSQPSTSESQGSSYPETSSQLASFIESEKSTLPNILSESIFSVDSQLSSCPETSSQLDISIESPKLTHPTTMSEPVFTVDSQLSSHPETSSQLGSSIESQNSIPTVMAQPLSSVELNESSHPQVDSFVGSLRSFQNAILSEESFIPNAMEEDSD